MYLVKNLLDLSRGEMDLLRTESRAEAVLSLKGINRGEKSSCSTNARGGA